MHTDTLEILKAKASALRALREALAKSGHCGEASLSFVTTWTEAVENMIPAETEDALDPKVTRWQDRAGDVWVPNSGGGWRVEGGSDYPSEAMASLSQVAQFWGPLTDSDQS